MKVPSKMPDCLFVNQYHNSFYSYLLEADNQIIQSNYYLPINVFNFDLLNARGKFYEMPVEVMHIYR